MTENENEIYLDDEFVMAGYRTDRMVIAILSYILDDDELTTVLLDVDIPNIATVEAEIEQDSETTDWVARAIENHTPYYWAEGDLWRRCDPT